MPPRLVIVNWPDFMGDEDGLDRSAPLVAHALWHRCLSSGGQGWVYPGADREAAATFSRWGFQLLDTPAARPETLSALPLDGARHAILAMTGEHADAARPSLGDREVEVLAPEGRVGEMGFSLSEALHLPTAAPTGLFVDWSCLSRVFRSLHPGTAPRDVVAKLLQRAELVGSLVQVRLYGPWASGPVVDLSGPGAPAIPASSDLVPGEAAEMAEDALCDDLRRALGDGPRLDTWILVSEAPWLESMAKQAREAGIRVLHWQPRQDRHPLEIHSEFDAVRTLETLLDLGAPPAHLSVQTPAIPLSERFVTVRPELGERVALRPSEPSLPSGVIPIGSQLSPWVRLIYRVEYHLRGSRWRKIPYRKLASLLAEDEEFGPTPAQAQLWLNRAQAEGMLTVSQEAHRTDPTLRVSVCRLNPSHPVTTAALDVPESSIRLLRQMLQKMPWVSFKLLRGVLLREQWLGGPPFCLDEAGVDEWLNFLVRDNVLRMTKERNLENPDYPVTALRLNEEHPLCRTVLTQAAEGRRLAAERAILAIDHFTRRNRKPWMAMSALRRALTGMGRDELQEVLQGLQNLGAVVTESYPNPRKEHFTTGCSLKLEDPFVQETLKARNQIIRVTEYHQRYRTWVPIQTLEQELAALGDQRSSSTPQSAWLMLLRDEGLLEMDQDAFSPDGWSNARCRLNNLDSIVRSILSEADDVYQDTATVA